MSRFAFYDFETTGISPAFDQPLQFAAILTDEDFAPLETVDVRCRLAPHVLPSPMALAVTGVTPAMLTDPSLVSWSEFSGEISGKIKEWAPATWVGYNSLSFDENVMRQMFYQNLHPNIFQTQTGGNDRMDVMRVVYAVWVLARDVLEWPKDEKGRISFKLDRLAPASGFTEHDAHDALGDVRATIYILSLIRDRAPEVYARCLRNRDKDSIKADLRSGQPMMLIERFGAAPPRQYAGVFAGQNPQNPNALGFLDLEACNPADLIDASDDALFRAVDGTPKLIRTVAANQTPNLFPITEPSPESEARAALVASRPDFQDRVGLALSHRFADRPEPVHVEEQIYSGFFTENDKGVLREFQAADWEQRVRLLDTFEDQRLLQLGRRVVYANAPALLSEEYRNLASGSINARWNANDPETPWTNRKKVQSELQDLEAGNLVSGEVLEEMKRFYGSLFR